MKCVNCGKKLAYDRADIGCVVVARRKTPGRSEVDFADKLLSAMRYQFGGHLEKSDGNSEAA
jgi:6-phosphogluconate dehydrogenase (decarboxylating)